MYIKHIHKNIKNIFEHFYNGENKITKRGGRGFWIMEDNWTKPLTTNSKQTNHSSSLAAEPVDEASYWSERLDRHWSDTVHKSAGFFALFFVLSLCTWLRPLPPKTDAEF